METVYVLFVPIWLLNRFLSIPVEFTAISANMLQIKEDRNCSEHLILKEF